MSAYFDTLGLARGGPGGGSVGQELVTQHNFRTMYGGSTSWLRLKQMQLFFPRPKCCYSVYCHISTLSINRIQGSQYVLVTTNLVFENSKLIRLRTVVLAGLRKYSINSCSCILTSVCLWTSMTSTSCSEPVKVTRICYCRVDRST